MDFDYLKEHHLDYTKDFKMYISLLILNGIPKYPPFNPKFYQYYSEIFRKHQSQFQP